MVVAEYPGGYIVTKQNGDFGSTGGPPSDEGRPRRRALLLDALSEEERILHSEMESLRTSNGLEPHVITQLSETLQRMLYLTEGLANEVDAPD
jgi:hypothetical protein